ncbi:MAG: L-serine ammonia-lyase, iron-sulfur-dependent subunit beta [Lachnospirales bacterium]
MNIMQVVGPIMVGPSSSHTAGVVRLGKVCYRILGGTPKEAEITFYRSFAKTYKGHGSDKAIVAGLLNFTTDDERIVNAVEYAKELGFDFRITPSEKYSRHPNTVKVVAKDVHGNQCEILGESIGGGEIRVRKIDGIDVELDGTYDTIITHHKDEPGVVTKLTKILYEANINIATMKVFRANKGDSAIMFVEVDHKPSKEIIEDMKKLNSIQDIKFIPKIF